MSRYEYIQIISLVTEVWGSVLCLKISMLH